MKKFAFAVLALAILVVGIGMADDLVNETPQTQGITTQTAVYALGTVTENDAFVWQQSSEMLNGAPLSEAAGERMYVVSYTEDTIMDQGYGEYTKQMSLDTRNKVSNQFNFEATKLVDFAQDEQLGLGEMTTEESILIDGAGQNHTSYDRFICPFGSALKSTIPDWCNIVEMGSSFTGFQVENLNTDVEERHVASSADTPAALNYEVELQNAYGHTEAWINAHLMEARGNNTLPSVDIVYNELTTADGFQTVFYKRMQYESGLRRA
jgi:hypothetical protein